MDDYAVDKKSCNLITEDIARYVIPGFNCSFIRSQR